MPELILAAAALLFVFYCGKLVGKLGERSNERKRRARWVRQRITMWHLGQMSDVYLRPDEMRRFAERLVDHLLSERDEYLVSDRPLRPGDHRQWKRGIPGGYDDR